MVRDLNKYVYPSPESSAKGIATNPVLLEAVQLHLYATLSLSSAVKDQHPKALSDTTKHNKS